MNNPFLICTDRELRALPTQWLLAERWDKAGSLLYDPKFMDATVKRMGIDELLQEYASGLRLLPRGYRWQEKLATIRGILDRQAHYLRSWDVHAQPAFFLQQLRNDTFQFDLSELRACAEAELARWRLSYLLLKVKGNRESPELVRTCSGHSSDVTDVVLSADCRLAVSASDDGMLKVWNVTTGRELHTLRGHKLGVHSVALRTDGQLAVSGSEDKTLKVWDLAAGCELRTLKGNHSAVVSVALSDDGRLVVSMSKKRTLKVWETATGRELLTLRSQGTARSADGRLAASASSDGMFNVWDVATGRGLLTRRRQGRLAVSTGSDGTLTVREVATGRELRTLRGHSDIVSAVALSADGRLAVSASKDRTLKVWDISALCDADLATNYELEQHTFRGHSAAVFDIALSADGRLAASASKDKTLKVWDVATGRELLTRQGHGVALSADGQLALSASEDETLINVWDVATGRELRVLDGKILWVTGMTLSADGRLAVSASWDKTFKVWDVATGHQLRTFHGHRDQLLCVVLSADGRLALSASVDKMLKVWDMTTGRVLHSFAGHDTRVKIALSGDGQRAVSASYDAPLGVWRFLSILLPGQVGNALHPLAEYSVGVKRVMLSSAGQLVDSTLDDILSSKSNTFKVWDVPTGRTLCTFKGLSFVVNDIALNADGRLAVFASQDQALRVCDVETGRIISIFPTSAPLCCCAMTPDGKTIVAGDQIGGVHFWELVLPE